MRGVLGTGLCTQWVCKYVVYSLRPSESFTAIVYSNLDVKNCIPAYIYDDT